MLAVPPRLETKASRAPSGEKIGRDSVAGSDTSSWAVPPWVGTVQMSPPETKAISDPSGDSEGSPREGADQAAPAIAPLASTAPAKAPATTRQLIPYPITPSTHLLPAPWLSTTMA